VVAIISIPIPNNCHSEPGRGRGEEPAVCRYYDFLA
jgi:hypothetical protein